MRTSRPAQSALGGVVQLTPAQGSALQVPPEQPNVQLVSEGVYEQLPLLQVPVEA